MGSRRPRILFLSHSASRNGATILLLELIRWLRSSVNWDLEVLMNGRGPLVGEFQSLCRTTVWRDPSNLTTRLLPTSLESRVLPRLEFHYMRTLLARRRFDLVYANTAASWRQVAALAGRAPTLLWHIHELGYGLRRVIGEERGRRLFPQATRFIAVSQSVAETLVAEFGAAREKIDLVHGFVPVTAPGESVRATRRQQVRDRLGWPAEAFVVGGCGSLGWRKGTDLFLQVARLVCQGDIRATTRFLWVGGDGRDPAAAEFEHDQDALGLGGRCRRIDTTADVSDLYCAMDAFALTSREDPFPLVMLEAGAHGLPVVCFDKSGGGPEFVGNDAGLVAPYLDVASFAAHVRALRDNRDACSGLGSAASEKVRRYFGIESQGPKLLESIQLCLDQAGAGR